MTQSSREKQPTDLELVTAARDHGDYLALQTFLVRMQPTALALVRRSWPGLSFHDAEDVVQEASLRFFDTLKKFDGEKSSPKTWYMFLALGRGKDVIRRTTRAKKLLRTYCEEKGDSKPYSDAPAYVKEQDLADVAISRIKNESYKEFIALRRHDHEISLEEIAGRLDISYAAVRKLSSRAFKAFAQALAVVENDDSEPGEY